MANQVASAKRRAMSDSDQTPTAPNDNLASAWSAIEDFDAPPIEALDQCSAHAAAIGDDDHAGAGTELDTRDRS